MDPYSPFIVTQIVFIFLALLLEGVVCCYFLFRIKSFTAATTYLIYLLHASSLAQNITAIPIIYTGNAGLCSFIGFASDFVGLVNLTAVVYISYIYYRYTKSDSMEINLRSKTLKHLPYILALWLILALGPLITNSYGAVADGTWCTITLDAKYTLFWSLLSYYLWAFSAVIVAFSLLSYTIYFNSKFKTGLSRRLFTTLGFYIISSILYILPRAVTRVEKGYANFQPTDGEALAIHLPLSFAGIAYAIIFFYDRVAIKRFERSTSKVAFNQEDVQFTLEDLEAAVFQVYDEAGNIRVTQSESGTLSSQLENRTTELANLKPTSKKRNSEFTETKSPLVP
jgi:hypothetical protein